MPALSTVAAVKAGAPVRILLLVSIAAAAMFALPSASASAAFCPVNPGNATAWVGGSGNFHTDSNWTNGVPSGACDVAITAAGSYTVTMTSGANMQSLALGGPGSTPTIVISSESPNTNLSATGSGIAIAPGAGITLTCPPAPGGCLGGASGGSGLNSGASTIVNQGVIKVAADSGTGATLSGSILNTGSIDIDQTALHNNGALTNQGAVLIADGKTLYSRTSSCGDNTGTTFKNDAGGTLVAEGTGTLNLYNFEQGAGTATGTNPVEMPCGSLKFTGSGAGKVRAYGGFALSGEMRSNQSLTVSAEGANPNPTLTGDFTNKGSITLTCPAGACLTEGGSRFNVSGHVFTNAGTFKIASDSGPGAAGIDSGSGGTIVNTGTMQFDQSGFLGGVYVNKGQLNIADGKTASSSGSSCGDTGPRVVNGAGGSINATGSGKLSVVNYEQGTGTISGAAPVQIPCGAVTYTGSGAGTVQLNGTVPVTGSLAAGQTLRVLGQANVSTLANSGTVDLVSGGTLNGSITNAGRLTGVGTVSGSVDNAAGTVAPGAGLGTLTVNGNFSQGRGTLEIEAEGTGAGQFDRLAVGGSATLGGTLALLPSPAFASFPPGTGIDFLAYGGSRSGSFAQVTSTPPLACPKAFIAAYDDGAKKASALIADSGSKCGGEEGGGGGNNGGGGGNGDGGAGGASNPPASNPPSSPPPARPGAKPLKCKKGFKKVRVKGKPRCAKVKKPKKSKGKK